MTVLGPGQQREIYVGGDRRVRNLRYKSLIVRHLARGRMTVSTGTRGLGRIARERRCDVVVGATPIHLPEGLKRGIVTEDYIAATFGHPVASQTSIHRLTDSKGRALINWLAHVLCKCAYTSSNDATESSTMFAVPLANGQATRDRGDLMLFCSIHPNTIHIRLTTNPACHRHRIHLDSAGSHCNDATRHLPDGPLAPLCDRFPDASPNA